MRLFGYTLLVFTGITAAVCICCPMLVVFGFVALIVPGLLLLSTPTLFVYLAATMGFQLVFPKKYGWFSFPIAILLTFGLSWLIMQPLRSSAISEFQAVNLPDILPDKPVTLNGNVYVENGELYRSPECDYLCAMLLDLPGVKSVTIENTNSNIGSSHHSVAAFALVRPGADAELGVFPLEPGRLIREHPGLLRTIKGIDAIEAEKALEADWAIRLAGAERIAVVEPTPVEKADWVVRLVSNDSKEHPQIERVEIVRAGSDVQYRKSHVRHFVPTRFLCFGFYVTFGAGTVTNASFGLGGSNWTSPGEQLVLAPTLLEAIDMPRLADLGTTRERLRREVQLALDDPNASPAKLELARRWLAFFFFNADKNDCALIARIVGDRRIKDIAIPMRNLFHKGKAPDELNIAYAQRITFDDSTHAERAECAAALASMSPGIFANPDPAHLEIWTRPELYEQAGPFLSRLADLGAERALPMLNDALDHVTSKKYWTEQRVMVEGIREAYTSLGPAAKQDATRIRSLIFQRERPIAHSYDDVQAWRLTLAKMGVALDDLPFFPQTNQNEIERIKSEIQERLQQRHVEI